LGGEDGRGLIQDQNVCLPVERLHDFYALLRAHGEGLDQGSGVYFQPVLCGELTNARFYAVVIKQP